MLGSAPRADVWLLLTYRGPLGAKAFEESDLPAPVKQHLESVLERIPHARLQLISPDPDHDQDLIEFIVASGREVDPFYHRYELSGYDELLQLDIDASRAVEPGTERPALREPLFLVCTNGRRDPCCAQLGTPVFQAMQHALGGRVRQSSHVGGHRFAANVISFPHGLCYGRIQPDEVDRLVNGGGIALDRLRGRSCYSPIVQAAEGLLRGVDGHFQLSAYQLRGARQITDNSWTIEFEEPEGGAVHQLAIESLVSEEQDRVSCWSDKLAPATRYLLRSHVVGTAGG